MTVEIQDLHKSYTSAAAQIEVLKGLSASVSEGEVVAILGQSGSGKSTLLSLLSGLDDFDLGEIVIFGQKYSSLTRAERTAFRGKNIGIVFQQFHLIPHLTALENVLLPEQILGRASAVSVTEATELLQKVGLSHRLDHHPHQLSGGECQRVALARALVVKPKLLLADEPSGNLDPQTGEQVMGLLFELVKSLRTTTLLVTHNHELAKRCDRIFTLVDGQFKI